MMRVLPLVIFLGLAAFLALGLRMDPSRIESPLVDQPAPGILLPVLNSTESFDSKSLLGKPWLLNVFASWCSACIGEHPLLVSLAQRNDFALVGLNYKDKSNDAIAWLDRFGNPFTVVAADTEGRVAIDWGVYGAPETFIIDAAGTVRYKHVGPLTEAAMVDTVIPLMNSLSRSNTASLQ